MPRPAALAALLLLLAPTARAEDATWHDLPTPPGQKISVAAGGARADGAFLAGSMGERGWAALLGADGSQVLLDVPGGSVEAAAAAKDGGLLLAGHGDGKPWFGRLDAAGTLVAQTTFKAEVGGDWYAVAPFGDGAVLAGVHNPLASGVTNGWVAAVGPDAKLRWEQRLGTGNYHYFQGLAASPKAIFVVGAKKSGIYNGWTVVLGPDGKVQREVVDPSSHWQGLRGVAFAPGGGVYVAGDSSEQQGVVRSVGQATFARLDKNGKVLWRRAVGERVVSVGPPLATAGGVLALLATVDAPSAKTGALFLARVPADGGAARLVPLGGEAVMLDYVTQAGWILDATDREARVLLVRPRDGALGWRIDSVPLGR